MEVHVQIIGLSFFDLPSPSASTFILSQRLSTSAILLYGFLISFSKAKIAYTDICKIA